MILRFFPLSLLLWVLPINLKAQNNFQAPWQQKVNYRIDVKLDDQNHILRGFETIEYVNNSPQALTEIFMHLWPNAYKNDQTAFAKQLLENGDASFYFSSESDRGYIDSINFKINQLPCVWSFDSQHQDIAKINLKEALKPGDTCWISTPFMVKIPKVFSRLGHDGQTYNISQWYPKPAVFDANGWNAMPYLNQGEFYSEFGAFDVKISLPKNYIIAATGELHSPEEELFRKDKGLNTGVIENTYVKTPYKIVQFKQDHIHDFAWFASKNFGLVQSSISIQNQTIATYVYSQKSEDLNHLSTMAIKTALAYYSDHAGLYPYSHASLVKSELKAGGGMEYPMITICDILNPEVIIHEVGHNWFYGILGSNERKHPWMDESINSYFEAEATKILTITPEKQKNNAVSNQYGMEVLAINTIRNNNSQAVGLSSEIFTDANYGLMVYGKGSLIFKHLKAYLGDSIFKNCFNAYFNLWKFKHPLPGDIQAVFEMVSEKKLDWFFKDLIQMDKKLDVKLKSVRLDKHGLVKIEIKKNRFSTMPVPIILYHNNDSVFTLWTSSDQTNLYVPSSIKKISHAIIDPKKISLDANRKNNFCSAQGLLKRWPSSNLKLFTRADDAPKRDLYVIPILGFNIYNSWTLGAVMHNWSMPLRQFEYTLAPLWSFKTNTLNGYINLKYSLAPKKIFQNIDFALNNSSFAYLPASETYTYYRSKGAMTFQFKPKLMRSSKRHYLSIDFTHVRALWLKKLSKTQDTILAKFPQLTNPINYGFAKLSYRFENRRAINPYSVILFTEHGGHVQSNSLYLKPGAEFNFFKTYHKKNKGLSIRVFAGTFYSNQTYDNGLFMYRLGAKNGTYDYGFEHSLIGRGADNGLWGSQISHSDDQLKIKGNLGNINKGFLVLNLMSTLPGKIPIRPYADFCWSENSSWADKNSNPKKMIYSAGIALQIIPKIFMIYLPLAQSSWIVETQNLQRIDSFEKRICFTFILNELEPHKLFKHIKLF